MGISLKPNPLAKSQLSHLLSVMRRIRAFEERARSLYKQNYVYGALHLYIGEEAIATGVCAALRSDDYVVSTHRGHGHSIAKGAETKYMFAELMGRSTGYSGGYGGSMPPDGYLQGVRSLCDNYGILLIFDEVQTGFGKTGKWFACEHWNVIPDIITVGKGLTGGYIPLGAAVTTPKVADVFRDKPGHELRSGSTYGGHTVACTATLANIEYMQQNDLVNKAVKKGAYLKSALEKLYKYPIVGDVRGIGMLWAVELMAQKSPKKRLDAKLGVGSFIRQWCWDHGMIMRNNGDILVAAPALIMSDGEMDMMVDLLDQAVAAAMKNFRF